MNGGCCSSRAERRRPTHAGPPTPGPQRRGAVWKAVFGTAWNGGGVTAHGGARYVTSGSERQPWPCSGHLPPPLRRQALGPALRPLGCAARTRPDAGEYYRIELPRRVPRRPGRFDQARERGGMVAPRPTGGVYLGRGCPALARRPAPLWSTGGFGRSFGRALGGQPDGDAAEGKLDGGTGPELGGRSRGARGGMNVCG